MYAREAFDLIEGFTLRPQAEQKAVRSRLRQLPAQLHQSGLAATLAYIRARAASGADRVVPHAYHLTSEALTQRFRDHLGYRGGSVISWMASLEAEQYAIVHRDVLEFATWLKRAAEAELATGDG